MTDIKTLLTRKTIKQFREEAIPEDVLETALKIAYKSPTSMNSRPVTMRDVTEKRDAEWILNQISTKTADRIFLFSCNPNEGEMNARRFLADRMGVDIYDEKINGFVERFIAPDKEGMMKQQLYITAGYFSAALEAEGVGTCYIAGFDREKCKSDLELEEDVYPELLMSCGYADLEDPMSTETDFVRSFDEFYVR